MHQDDSHISLRAENVSYLFAGQNVGVRDLSLTAQSGELVAIMGGSGSGKTTTINLLSGILKPTSGSVNI